MKKQLVLDKYQLKAINHTKGPLLIIAGAGTGKTTVITERIKHLVLEKKIEPSKILALTFTEKAALEMEERVDKVMPYGYTQMWISTFHSFCDRVLRNEAIHIGLNPSYKLHTEAESILFIRENIFKFKLNYYRPLGNPNKFLSALIQHFSRLKDEDVTPDEYIKYVKKDKLLKKDKENYEKYLELSNAYKVYEELKAKEGVMDFSDLISNTLKLFRKRNNVLKTYQDQFEYILIDEFQDTNFAQNELAILLSGVKKNITVVGDDDQSIYRFRGSSVSNIIQFKQRFPNTVIITLVNNYRSTQEILDKSYKVIQNNNPDRLEVKEKLNKKLISVRKKTGEKINLIYEKRVEDEAEEVAKTITNLIKEKKYDYKDIAILVRANDHAENFVRAFERKKIPYQFLGPGRLFHQEEIKDLIAYLKVLYNFEDSVSLYRVLNMKIFNFDGVEISTLLNYCRRKNLTLFESLQNLDEIYLKKDTKEKLEYIEKMIKRHLNLVKKETAGQILYYFLNDSGLIKEMIDYKNISGEKVAKNIAKFFDKLKSYEIDHNTAFIYEVVDWIDLSMQMGESPLASDMDWGENNAVNILTIHSSKGLEFPVVFLVNLVSQRFPTRERAEKIPIPQFFIKEILPSGDYHLEEERRLFYVGLTRARDLLFVTAANYYGEGKRERKLSPFLYELFDKDEFEKKLKPGLFKNEDLQLSLLSWETKNNKDEEKIISKNIPINYLSYSQIQTFEMCPLHYKLKYLLKIPTPQSASQSFGTSVHAVLRDYYQNWKTGNKIKVNQINKLLEKDWINEGYTSKTHEKKSLEKAEKIIINYLNNNFKGKNLPLEIEYPFIFHLNNIRIGGRIDRIDKIDNKQIEIIDYKTGENVLLEKDVKDNFQLTFYALAASEVKEKVLNKKPEDVLLSLYFLEKDVKLSTIRTKEQLEDAKVKILEKAKEISESDFKCNKSIYCKNCEYKMLCSTFI
jgi:DNA helicase-2/ATP-dependent DNA helicase PcrA